MPIVNDGKDLREGLDALWRHARADVPRGAVIYQVGVALLDICLATIRQSDLLENDDAHRKRWERVSGAMDALNGKHARTLVHLGD